MRWWQTTILTALLAGVLLAAFTLSFDAQVRLAIACGVTPTIGFLYPLVVDAAILTGVLISVWRPDLEKGLRRYLWGAIALWTAISVIGNATHVLALPAGEITLPLGLAIAVNTIPAVTLFLLIHLTSRTIRKEQPPAKPARRRSARATGNTTTDKPVLAREAKWAGIGAAVVTDGQLLEWADAGDSLSTIANRIGRSKSYAGARVLEARRTRQETAA